MMVRWKQIQTTHSERWRVVTVVWRSRFGLWSMEDVLKQHCLEFILPCHIVSGPLCQEFHSAKTNYSVNTALKRVGHSASLFTFSSKQPWHPSTDWFCSQKPPQRVFICLETGIQFALKWMDMDFSSAWKTEDLAPPANCYITSLHWE